LNQIVIGGIFDAAPWAVVLKKYVETLINHTRIGKVNGLAAIQYDRYY